MIIHTRNTSYTLIDLGDGLFEVVERKARHDDSALGMHVLPVGTRLTLMAAPVVGESLWGTKVFSPEPGCKLGTFKTSYVCQVEA